MRVAFKEWAVVVDALEQGDQVVILRKGGIAEGPGSFQVEHEEFLLFPTLYHQQGEQVIPSASARLLELQPTLPGADRVRIQSYAKVAAWWRLESLEAAQRLRGFHVWRDEVIADRFDWGGEQAIYALVLRVWRMAASFELPLRPEYGGCKSWITLATDLPIEGSKPALNDLLFDSARIAVARAVEGTL